MTYVSTPRFTLGRCAPLLLALLPLAFGCAKVTAADGVGGTTGAVSGSGGGGGLHGSGGRAMLADGGVTIDMGVCQTVNYKFTPKIPNVVVLVDGSGSMFQVSAGLPNGAWDALRTAVLPVIQTLQTTPTGDPQIDFGLEVFTGVAPAQCPLVQTVAIGEKSYTRIAANYPAGRLSTMKLETPVTQVLPLLPGLFTGAPGNGGNYVLFVTDGEPDFCDDGNPTCAVDAVVAELRQLSVQGITTYIMGLSSNLNTSTCPGVLPAYANAGVNQPIASPCGTHNFYDECNGNAPWKAIATSTGRTTGQALVDYVPTGGAGRVFMPDPTDQKSLTDTLAGLFSGVKSCTFDLTNIDGMAIKVNTGLLDKAKVIVQSTAVPLDNANGWRVNCVPAGDPACKPTQLELTGTACTNWRLPANTDIDFQFPCDVIIPG